VLFI